ncbi:hypothetical protein BDV95DRAFT_582781 [Massariosphaeria phaeospora]|uniref:Autophagy-related protein 29 n=1 Tax=Massariosphaeria phaeospora TaxID=100035 RepID=A0A7C8I0B5_9PLEO|nr:hypothetical protein BDV95DRAFT_582781 [Massariosphaeria phaeospora]
MAAIQFTTLVRLPFARGNFVDPPQADWNATKDRALWKVISKSSKTSDLDWVELAARFQVPPTFLLQQAAWLYDRHLDHVRAQMKKVGNTYAPSAFNLGSAHMTMGDVSIRKIGSSDSGAYRAISSVSAHPKDGPFPRVATDIPIPSLSRTPSATTITQSPRAYAQSPPVHMQPLRSTQASLTSSKHLDQSETIISQTNKPTSYLDAEIDSPGVAESSSSGSSLSDSGMANPAHRSQLFKRPPRFRSQRPREPVVDEDHIVDGAESEPSTDPLLPFAHKPSISRYSHDSAGTSRAPTTIRKGQLSSFDATQYKKSSHPDHQNATKPRGLDANSSVANPTSDAVSAQNKSPSSLVSKQQSESIGMSPQKPGPKSRKEGSEGTPSMGSSFSDIDDAGISQSALEEVLLSNIHHGRMSTLSQLRSRYL